MNNYTQKIYDMIYSPILTPHNLLDNAKLDNYSYVKYLKKMDGLVVEMECEIPYDGVNFFITILIKMIIYRRFLCQVAMEKYLFLIGNKKLRMPKKNIIALKKN